VSSQYYGTVGLVLANCVNMALRIAYSLTYARTVRGGGDGHSGTGGVG